MNKLWAMKCKINNEKRTELIQTFASKYAKARIKNNDDNNCVINKWSITIQWENM